MLDVYNEVTSVARRLRYTWNMAGESRIGDMLAELEEPT